MKLVKSYHESAIRKVKAESPGTVQVREGPNLLIPREYRDLDDVFNKKDSDMLPPHGLCN